LPWKTCEDLVVKYFLKVGTQGKFDNLKDLATLLAYIKDKYPFVVIKITDYLIDQVDI
jgi:hypothetical protein